MTTTDAAPNRCGAGFEHIDTYSVERITANATVDLREFLKGSKMAAELAGALGEPQYAVKLYRVTYNSVVPEHGNCPTVASGLIAIPDTDATVMPLVSYQHGTVFNRW